MKTKLPVLFAAFGLTSAPAFGEKKDPAIERFETYAKDRPEWNEAAQAAFAEAEGAGRITAALRLMHPDFAKAVEKVTGTPLDEDMAPLKAFTESEDPWLAAEAAYFLARALVNLDRHEEALPLMDAINEKYAGQSARVGESLYYEGLSLERLLRRDDAADAYNTFIDEHPNASLLLRDRATEAIAWMEGIEQGSIGDVADHMGLSGRRLKLEDAGDPTQQVQKKIIDMLDDLIEKAEEQEQQQQQQQQQQSGSSSQSQGGQPGSGENNQQGGNASAQKPPKVLRRVRGATKSAWDDLRDRERTAEALSALKSKYPPRYQQLIEQYFRDLQESAEEEGAE